MALYDGDPRAALLNFVGNVYLINETKNKVVDFATATASDMAFEAALLVMGIEMRSGKRPTLENIGVAIGDKIKAESGLDIGNILEPDSQTTIREKIERAGIAKFMMDAGIEGAATRDGLAAAFKAQVNKKINELVANGDLQGVAVSVSAVEDIKRLLDKRDKKELLQSKNAIANRARQAVWRQTHRRVLA